MADPIREKWEAYLLDVHSARPGHVYDLSFTDFKAGWDRAVAAERERCAKELESIKHLCPQCRTEWQSPNHSRCEGCGHIRSPFSIATHLTCLQNAAAIRGVGGRDG